MSTKEVIDHHNEAFGNLDIEEVMADYDDDSVIITEGTEFRGTDEIRPVFEGFFEEFDSPETEFTLNEYTIRDNVAYIAWEAETPENVYELGTDTFVVEDGVIRTQTYTDVTRPK